MDLQVPGAEVTVYRVRDPVKGDDHSLFDEGVLDAPVASVQVTSPAMPQAAFLWKSSRSIAAATPVMLRLS